MYKSLRELLNERIGQKLTESEKDELELAIKLHVSEKSERQTITQSHTTIRFGR